MVIGDQTIYQIILFFVLKMQIIAEVDGQLETTVVVKAMLVQCVKNVISIILEDLENILRLRQIQSVLNVLVLKIAFFLSFLIFYGIINFLF